MWEVKLSRKVEKALHGLPRSIRDALSTLLLDIEKRGPIRGNWDNYGKLGKNRHHCHLKKGRPTYVAVWMEYADGVRIAEVEYVGTHERAPY